MARRLVGFMIDCERAGIGPAAAFWSGALGLPIEDPDEGGQGRYAVLGAAPGGLHVEVQSVEHASRLHLDIEADDIEAEADALEALGASRVAKPHGRWWVMQAPSGHRFCLVRKRPAATPADPQRTRQAPRHRSALVALVIDCQVEALAPALAFWSAALGRAIVNPDQDGDGSYAELESAPDEPFVLLQRVAHESRVHLDIESDDLDAEVLRLEALGATREGFCKRWWVMRAPTGQRFCVVGQQAEKPGIARNAWGPATP
jgi:predicted enzyme related to lactoylglutathione lyase